MKRLIGQSKGIEGVKIARSKHIIAAKKQIAKVTKITKKKL